MISSVALCVVVTLLILVLSIDHATAQPARMVYIYDDLGRLAKVIDTSTGSCAVYLYDAVGNILSIARRGDCALPPVVGSFSPGPEPSTLVADGTNLLGATVSFDVPGFTASEIRTTDDTLRVRFSAERRFCRLSGVATIATAFGSVRVPVTVTGTTLLPTDGEPIADSIAVPGEADEYCFELASSERVILQVTSTTSSSFVAPCIELQTVAGGPVAGGKVCAPARGTGRLDLTLSGGTYFVVVSEENNDATVGYNLLLTRFTGATVLVPDVPVADTITPVGDLDLYTFTLGAAERVILQVTSTTASSFVAPCIELRTPAGEPVAGGQKCAPARGTGQLDLTLPAGTYLVVVSEENNDAAVGYNLLLTRFTGATVLVPDVPVADTITPVGDLDLYTFTLGAAERVILQVTSTTASSFVAPCIELRTPAGEPVAGGQKCAPARGTGQLDLTLPAGTYLVVVSEENNDAAVGYNLLLTRFTGATVLVPDVPVADTITPVGDLDLYTFTLGAAERVILQVTSTTASSFVAPCIELRTPAGEPVAGGKVCAPARGTGQLDLTLPAGTYLVVVSEENNDAAVGYSLLLTRFTGATVLVPDVPVADTISPAGDLDLYTFTLGAEERVVLQVTSTTNSSFVAPCIELRTPAGVPVAGGQICAPARGTGRLDLTLPAGTYLVVVSEVSNAAAVAYILLLTR